MARQTEPSRSRPSIGNLGVERNTGKAATPPGIKTQRVYARIEGLDPNLFTLRTPVVLERVRQHAGARTVDIRAHDVCDEAVLVSASLASDLIHFVQITISDAGTRGVRPRAAIHTRRTTRDDPAGCDVPSSLLAEALAGAQRQRLIVSAQTASMLLGNQFAAGQPVARVHPGDDEPVTFFAMTLTEDTPMSAIAVPAMNFPAQGTMPMLPLSNRERAVASLVAQGRTNRDVAALLSIATSTVERHIASLFGKLHVQSRVQLAALAAAGHFT